MGKLLLKRKRTNKETYIVREPRDDFDPVEQVELEEELEQVEVQEVKEIENAQLVAEEKARQEAEEEARRIAAEEAKKQLEELKREEVNAAEVKEIVNDEVAEALIEKEIETEKVFGNKKGIINLDVISRNFEAGDVVTINVLKEKKLVDKNVGFIKVLARGVLDKPLVVKAHDFSIDAAKMIELTGGNVVMLTKRKFF